MKMPQDFSPVSYSFTEERTREFLKWISLDDSAVIYPTFFKTELKNPENTVRHFVNDERI